MDEWSKLRTLTLETKVRVPCERKLNSFLTSVTWLITYFNPNWDLLLILTKWSCSLNLTKAWPFHNVYYVLNVTWLRVNWLTESPVRLSLDLPTLSDVMMGNSHICCFPMDIYVFLGHLKINLFCYCLCISVYKCMHLLWFGCYLDKVSLVKEILNLNETSWLNKGKIKIRMCYFVAAWV